MRFKKARDAYDNKFLLLAIAGYLGAGLIQYLPVALLNLSSGTVSMFDLKNINEAAGFERFAKDILNIVWGIWWPIKARGGVSPGRWNSFISVYFLWMLCLIGIGLIPAVLGISPIFFVPAGLRWLLLLHCSIGLFFLYSNSVIKDDTFSKRLRILVYISLLMDIVFIVRQVPLVTSQYGQMLLGASRLTGMFSHAGVAGAFAVGLTALLLQYEGSKPARIAGIIGAGFIALAAGSRWGLISIFVMTAVLFWGGGERGRLDGGVKTFRRLIILLLFIAAGYNGYSAMISQVNRGDMFETQFEKGGRVQNTIESLRVIMSSSPMEFTVGQGLGVGTNTVIGQMLNLGQDTEAYKFNMLVDNSFITVFFQFGLLGSFVFWGGLLVLFLKNSPSFSMRSSRYWIILLILVATTAVTSIFESFFSMTLMFAAMGMDAGRLKRVEMVSKHTPRWRGVF